LGNLKKRVLSGCILAPVVAALFYFLPPLWFFLFLSAVAVVALFEITDMAEIKGRYVPILLALITLIPLYFKLYHLSLLWFLASPLAYLVLKLLQGKGRMEGINEEVFKGTTAMLFGQIFVLLPFFSMYLLKELDTALPLVLLMTLWASDTCAYVVGKNFGKRPLAPQMSPNKTCEGLAGAIIGSMIIICLFHHLLGFRFPYALLVGAATGVLGQAGDLLESVIKRVSNRKDSSSLIPGHGGILDRIDSFVFAAPFFYICIQWKV
jgi:phosphatidate cytidylyltransferase